MATSIHGQIQAAVVTGIKALALSGIPDAQVYTLRKMWDRGLTLPCVVVALGDREDLSDRGSYEDTVVGYPIDVWILKATNQSNAVNDTELTWRQQIMMAFIDKPLTGITTSGSTSVDVFDCRVVPGPIYDDTALKEANMMASSMALVFQTTVSRNRA